MCNCKLPEGPWKPVSCLPRGTGNGLEGIAHLLDHPVRVPGQRGAVHREGRVCWLESWQKYLQPLAHVIVTTAPGRWEGQQ